MTTKSDKVVLGLATAHHEIDKTCRYVNERPHRYHRQLMSVFVSASLISASGGTDLTFDPTAASHSTLPQNNVMQPHIRPYPNKNTQPFQEKRPLLPVHI